MRSVNKSSADERWLKVLGKHIEKMIKERGYDSPYDFWVNKAGDHISRSTLNYILAGKTDPKATTIRTLAKLLKVKESKILDF